jgi:hypothetical protein
MARNTLEIISFGAALALGTFVVGCGDGGNTPPGDSSGEDDGDTGESGESGGDSGDGDCAHPTNADGAADGAACTANADCMSDLCLSFSDAPADAAAVCEPAPDMCRTRTTGTVRDFITRAALSGGQEVVIAGAIAASVNPTNITNPEAEGVLSDDGTFDLVSTERIEQPLGIVAVIKGGGYHLSATGLASPVDMNFYGPGTSLHDAWAVSTTDLDSWNMMLASDTALADFLPLGDEGGVIGMIRDEVTGDPLTGVTVEPKDGDSSNALIRYLNDGADAFDGASTGTSGIFIVVDPGLGEEFLAMNGTTELGEGTAGSAPGSLFIMVMDVPAP